MQDQGGCLETHTRYRGINSNVMSVLSGLHQQEVERLLQPLLQLGLCIHGGDQQAPGHPVLVPGNLEPALPTQLLLHRLLMTAAGTGYRWPYSPCNTDTLDDTFNAMSTVIA